MKKRYFLEIAYHGKPYHGWQVQPNAITVQEILNDCLQKLLREEIYVVGSGRTDTGVHCRQQFAHFDTTSDLPPEQIQYKLNAFLPDTIGISRVLEVVPEAHARFDATFRRYEYHISTVKNPFLLDTAWWVKPSLNFDAMNEAAQLLTQWEDFESFCKTHTQNDHFRCDVTHANWEKTGISSAVFHIKANRFLRGMVRLIVGELVHVGSGKKSIKDFQVELEARQFAPNRTAAPAHGLFLCEVGYPSSIFL